MVDRAPRDVIARIQALDRALAGRSPSHEANERVRQQLARKSATVQVQARTRAWPMLAFVAGAAWMALAPALTRSPEPEAATITARCASLGPGVQTLDAGACVAVEGVEIDVRATATIEGHRDRIEVVEGEVVFEVESREDHPLHVIAGATDIEVVGTRFVVRQHEGVGSVTLLEGRVRVRIGAGEPLTIDQGQRLDWPAELVEADEKAGEEADEEAAPEPARELGKAPARPSRARDRGLARLLEQVAGLRRAGEFQAALDHLRRADPRGWTRRSRQLVSYEIGTLLERQLDDTDAACEHWAAHRAEFPGGRYDAIVERALERLGCAAR